jgi:hypothetical protein
MKESGIVGVMGLTIPRGRGFTTEPAQGKISARLFNDVVQNRLTSYAFTWVPALPVIGLNRYMQKEGAENYESTANTANPLPK